MRFYGDTALPDTTVTAMARFNPKTVEPRHECESPNPDIKGSGHNSFKCWYFAPGDGKWEALPNNGLFDAQIMSQYMKDKFGDDSYMTFAFDWGWGKPSITVDKDGGIWADLGTSMGVGDAIMHQAPGESTFSFATETVEGTCNAKPGWSPASQYDLTPCVLHTCFGDWQADLCKIKWGRSTTSMAEGYNLYRSAEDGHMYAVGYDVRRWLPTARKWSLPVATSAGAGNRQRHVSGSSVFYFGRKMKAEWDTTSTPFGSTQGMRDGYASVVRFGAGVAGILGRCLGRCWDACGRFGREFDRILDSFREGFYR